MRMRRHTGPAFGSLRDAPWGRFVRDLGLVTLTFVVGYIVSAYWITPGSVTGDEHAVPRVLDRPLDEARAALTKAGFRVRLEGERSSASVPRGGVVWQDPPPGTALGANAVVLLTPSAGPTPATVPDVIGFALPNAEKVIQAAGIRVGRVDTVRGGAPESGVVIATRPAPGNGRPRGSAVDLVVSGPPGGGS
jgi:eukaryotic-like serine/threonine-protein kinase